MRVTPGETDSLPTRAAPAAAVAAAGGGAPLTRRTSFAATTAISRRSSNAAAAASKGGDFEEGLPLDVVEEPDSLTEHGMPVVFEVRCWSVGEKKMGRRSEGEEMVKLEKGPAGRRAIDSRRDLESHAGGPCFQQARAFFSLSPRASQAERITSRAFWTGSCEWVTTRASFLLTRVVEDEEPIAKPLSLVAISLLPFLHPLSASLSSTGRVLFFVAQESSAELSLSLENQRTAERGIGSAVVVVAFR